MQTRSRDVAKWPSQTVLQFVVLLIAAIAASVYVYEALYFAAHVDSEMAQLARCAGAGAAEVDPLAAQAAETACRAPGQRSRVLWTILFAPAAIGAAIMAIGWAPLARRRRYQLTRLPETARTAHRRTALAVEALGLKTPPRLMWQRRRVTGAAAAYGLPWKSELEVTPGTVALASVEPDRFDAIVRHELAHVRNNDIAIGAAAVGSLLAFVVVAVLPFVASMFRAGVPVDVNVSALARLAGLTALLHIVQRQVLRARELEADLRATTAGARMELLFVAAPRKGRRPQELLATHPSPASRLEILHEPERLLATPVHHAAIAGFFALLPVPTAARLASGWWTSSASGGTAALVVAGILALPFGAWLGVAAVRRTADTARHTTGIATGLAAGVGGALALAVFDRGLYEPVELLSRRGTDALALGVFISLVAGANVWLTATARRCVGRGFEPRLASIIVGVLGAAVIGLVVGEAARIWQLASSTDAGQAFGKDPGIALLEIIFGVTSAPLGAALLALLVFPPLAMRRRMSPPLARAFLFAAAVSAAGLVGYFCVRRVNARLGDIASAEVREQALVMRRQLLVNQSVGVLIAVVVAGALSLLLLRVGIDLVVAAAILAAGVTATVIVWTAPGAPGADDLSEVILPTVALAALVTLCVVSLGQTLTMPRRLSGRPASIVAAVVLLAVPFAVATPAAAYIAAPQPTFREVPAFGAWLNEADGTVLQVLELCSGWAVAPPAAEHAAPAAPIVAQVADAARAPRWTSGVFRRVQAMYADALGSCGEGLDHTAAGRVVEAKASYVRTLCRYHVANRTVQGVAGDAPPVPTTVRQLCGGKSFYA